MIAANIPIGYELLIREHQTHPRVRLHKQLQIHNKLPKQHRLAPAFNHNMHDSSNELLSQCVWRTSPYMLC